jgi:hypothetical protein
MDELSIARNSMGYSVPMKNIQVSALMLLSAGPGQAQSRPNDLAAILAKPLETPDVVGAGNLPWL